MIHVFAVFTGKLLQTLQNSWKTFVLARKRTFVVKNGFWESFEQF